MVKRVSILVFVCFSFALVATSQTVVHINAGSRANYGTYQNLLINLDGQCNYQLREVNGTTKDSSVFNISKSQLDSILQRAEQLGFFQLNNKYDGGLADGAGILIGLNNSGKKKTVQLVNTDLPQVNELVAFINHILEPQKIRIYYGQSVPQK